MTTLAEHPSLVFHLKGSKHGTDFPRRVVFYRPETLAGWAKLARKGMGSQFLFYNKIPKYAHDLFLSSIKRPMLPVVRHRNPFSIRSSAR
jgi:hypothetical protein